MASNVRQNYHEESESGVNKQINLELYAMYTYLSMVSLIAPRLKFKLFYRFETNV